MSQSANIYRTKLENGIIIKHPAKDLTSARKDANYWSHKHNSAIEQTALFISAK